MSIWKPIYSAPKDGTIFLGWDDGIIAEMYWGLGSYEKGFVLNWLVWADESVRATPTYWMDRPKDPEPMICFVHADRKCNSCGWTLPDEIVGYIGPCPECFKQINGEYPKEWSAEAP